MSRRHNSANKRTDKPAPVIRNKQSLDNQLRRISEENEDNSLIIPLSLLVIASYLNRLRFKEIINENFVRILLNGNAVLEFWLKSWFFQSLCLPEKRSHYPVSLMLLLKSTWPISLVNRLILKTLMMIYLVSFLTESMNMGALLCIALFHWPFEQHLTSPPIIPSFGHHIPCSYRWIWMFFIPGNLHSYKANIWC